MKKTEDNKQPATGAKGPNPLAVRAIFERAIEWKLEQSTTADVYQPIVDHGEAHRVAIEKMTTAIRAGNAAETEKFFDEAQYHERMQREAGAQARAYFLGKVAHGGAAQS